MKLIGLLVPHCLLASTSLGAPTTASQVFGAAPRPSRVEGPKTRRRLQQWNNWSSWGYDGDKGNQGSWNKPQNTWSWGGDKPGEEQDWGSWWDNENPQEKPQPEEKPDSAWNWWDSERPKPEEEVKPDEKPWDGQQDWGTWWDKPKPEEDPKPEEKPTDKPWDKPEDPVPPQPEKPDYPEWPEKPENPDYPEWPEKPENPDKPEWPEKPENPDKPEWPEKPENPDKPEWPEKPENPDKPEWPEKPEKPDKPEWPEKPEKPDKPDGNGGDSDKPDGDSNKPDGDSDKPDGGDGGNGPSDYTNLSDVAGQSGQFNVQIQHDGVARQFILYVPRSYDGSSAVPLFFNFHGFGGTARNFLEYEADMRPVADEGGFILVYPQGTRLPGGGSTHWNAAGPGADNKSTADDIGFVGHLIEQLASSFSVDTSRVYAAGYSNGGMFSYYLACFSRAAPFAAVASVSGTMLDDSYTGCQPGNPMGMINLHGTSDGVIPYSGGAGYTAIPDVVRHWVDYNRAQTSPTITTDRNIEHQLYPAGDRGGVDIEHYKYTGGEHVWFRDTFQGRTTSQLIWDYVSQYDTNGRRNTFTTRPFTRPATRPSRGRHHSRSRSRSRSRSHRG